MSRSNILALQAYGYDQIETSMCTGDIILYNDPCTDVPRPFLSSCAEVLTQMLTLLPCTTDIVTAWASRALPDEECLPEATPERQWLHWECAAVVVSMRDETETNPPITFDENKYIPYVFSTRRSTQAYEFIPLKCLLADLVTRAGQSHFALRQLMTNADRHRQNQRLCSQLRNSLATQILNFYREVQATAMSEVRYTRDTVLAARVRDIATALNDMTPRLPVKYASSISLAHKHRLSLFRASPTYFALFTLYRISVLRVEPEVSTAMCSVQEGGILETQLSGDYFLTDEIVFSYTRGK